jgi:MerR family copper efflux transcriptional regulator
VTSRTPSTHGRVLDTSALTALIRSVAELTQARDALRDLKRRAAATDPADCAKDEVCAILTTSARS